MSTRLCMTLVIFLMAACAAKLAPPVPFSQTAAFRDIDSSIFAILEADLNGDGMPDAIVARGVGPGWTPVVYMQTAGVEQTAWSLECTGPVVVGSELSSLRWMNPGSGRLAMLVATTENPDEATEHVVLVDPVDGCAVRFEDHVHLTRPNGAIVAPRGLSGGLLLDGEDGSLRIVDRPSYLTLDAAEGEVALLTKVRIRQLSGTSRQVHVEERLVELLRPLAVTIEWIAEPVANDAGDVKAADSPRVTETPELTDNDDATTFVARAGETGRLRIVGESPIIGFEIRHGCLDAEPVPLRLQSTEGKPHIVGERPVPGSFVRATGRRRITDAGAARVNSDLLLLGRHRTEWSLSVGPADAERCIRGLEAFGFR